MGDAVGIVILSLPFDSATKIIEAFTYEKMGADSDDFPDAVGELANMVAGGAKGKLESHNVSISTPSVIIGEQHRVMLQRGIRLIGLPCSTDIGEFAVYVSIKSVGEAAQSQTKPALPMS
jgi:chemotaxis protein CheX